MTRNLGVKKQAQKKHPLGEGRLQSERLQPFPFIPAGHKVLEQDSVFSLDKDSFGIVDYASHLCYAFAMITYSDVNPLGDPMGCCPSLDSACPHPQGGVQSAQA